MVKLALSCHFALDVLSMRGKHDRRGTAEIDGLNKCRAAAGVLLIGGSWRP